MAEFQVGQKVTVWGGGFSRSQIRAITKVERVGGRKMVLANGSEFAADGSRLWGCSRDAYYNGARVYEFKAGDDEKFATQRAVGLIENFRSWADLPYSDLATVAEVIRRYRAAKEQDEARRAE